MINLLFLFLVLISGLNCGKKVDDPGPQFSINSQDIKLDGQSDYVIDRTDENAGPTYKVGSDLSGVEYFDKKLSCGPVTLNARRSLKTDSNFSAFKISEAEFHGLNQLPVESPCTLNVIAANGNGSTVTKTVQLQLKFKTLPQAHITRMANVNKGAVKIETRTEIELEAFEITNPFSYPIPFIFRPQRFAKVAPVYVDNFKGEEGIVFPTHVYVFPTTTELSGTAESGFRFKVPPGQTIRILSSGDITRYRQAHALPPGDICGYGIPIYLFVEGYDNATSLIQGLSFDFVKDDPSPNFPISPEWAGNFSDFGPRFGVSTICTPPSY
jgi:hypothetical protein